MCSHPSHSRVIFRFRDSCVPGNGNRDSRRTVSLYRRELCREADPNIDRICSLLVGVRLGWGWRGDDRIKWAIHSLPPATDSPQNGGAWADFSLNITSLVVQGTNTLTFTHADWNCGVSDNVQNLQITNGASPIYGDSTSLALSCTQSLSYTFTV